MTRTTRSRFRLIPIMTVAVSLAALPQHRAGAQATFSDQDISDAYVYLLGRLLVLRQERLDFQRQGFQWNELVHRGKGGVAWPNPDLDVVYSEAWVATVQYSCTVITIPKIVGRYYTVQVLNGWGETLANANERTYPFDPNGPMTSKVALCSSDSKVIPAGAARVLLSGNIARVVTRVEIGANEDQARDLQHQFTMYVTGKQPAIDSIPPVPAFSLDSLPGAAAFDAAAGALANEPDVSPGMDARQGKVRAIALAVASDQTTRARVDKVIRQQTIPQFLASFATAATVKGGWKRPLVVGKYGEDYRSRTRINLRGIWANTTDEVVYFTANTDGGGVRLDGGAAYTMTFAKGDLPANHVKYFWSVIAVDSKRYRVIPNPAHRFLLNKQSQLAYGADSSLTLYFAPDKPKNAADGNWLPTPMGSGYNLTFRMYGPDQATVSGAWFPPPLVKQGPAPVVKQP